MAITAGQVSGQCLSANRHSGCQHSPHSTCTSMSRLCTQLLCEAVELRATSDQVQYAVLALLSASCMHLLMCKCDNRHAS